MKIIVQILLLPLLFLSPKAAAQNLIRNGDFEQCSRCPELGGELELSLYWSIPNHSTPDLLKKCPQIKSYVNVPLNANGYQEPNSGDTYVGIVVIHSTDLYRNYREYIQGELKEELTEGKSYRISFYMSWADYSNYFCDRIGYLFTNNKIKPGPKKTVSKKRKRNKAVDRELFNTVLPNSNGFVPLEIDILKDRENWYKVEFIYQARGGERYLTLGLFGDNITVEDYQRYTSQIYGKSSSIGLSAYFYIDDVTVTPVGKIEYTHGH